MIEAILCLDAVNRIDDEDIVNELDEREEPSDDILDDII